MPVLTNPKHEAFAQAVAKGASSAGAYRDVYKVKDSVAESAGPRLFGNVQVKERITELQEKGASKTVFDLEKTFEYIEEVLLTPIGDVNEQHKLCQEYSRTDSAESSTIRHKMPSKEGMLDKLIKLRGWYAAEKQEVDVRHSVSPAVEEALSKLLG